MYDFDAGQYVLFHAASVLTMLKRGHTVYIRRHFSLEQLLENTDSGKVQLHGSCLVPPMECQKLLHRDLMALKAPPKHGSKARV
jgi:hypothetical protein